ncbi:MAG: tetratricopeptide repeat protein, partial [Candidatus Zixiibacteriota bacterium]
GRAFYAILKFVLLRDPDGAMAELDTALILDPEFQLALSFYIELYMQQERYDDAITKAKIVKGHHPESPDGYKSLSDIYFVQNRFDESMAEGKLLLEKFPDHESILDRLVSIQIHKRNFEEARKYNEYIKERHGDDPYLMVDYYANLANFDFWNGRFKSGFENLKKAAKQADPTGDSILIYNQYSTISDYYETLERPDSALYYNRIAYKWASRFQLFDYPLLLVKIDPKNEPEARVLFDRALENFKERLPASLWSLGDRLKERFNTICSGDTVGQREAIRKIVDEQKQASTGNLITLGKYCYLTGQYAEARKELDKVVLPGAQNITSRVVSHMRAVYYHGMACEALGDTAAAIADYQEILKYWGKVDMKLDLVSDTRARLDKLTS